MMKKEFKPSEIVHPEPTPKRVPHKGAKQPDGSWKFGEPNVEDLPFEPLPVSKHPIANLGIEPGGTK